MDCSVTYEERVEWLSKKSGVQTIVVEVLPDYLCIYRSLSILHKLKDAKERLKQSTTRDTIKQEGTSCIKTILPLFIGQDDTNILLCKTKVEDAEYRLYDYLLGKLDKTGSKYHAYKAYVTNGCRS